MKRNEKCSCGSGKKFKHCCESKGPGPGSSSGLVKYILIGTIVLVASVAAWNVFNKQSIEIPEGHVW